jgi:hypothetical protein
MWPDYINRNASKDDNNQISLSCNSLENKYYTHVSQSSEKAANNLGRGMTSPFIHVDEGPFINHIETTVSAAMGSTSAAREIAKRKGKPYCTVFTTTAGNQEDRDGRYVFGMMAGAAIWSERFLDCRDRDELVNYIKTNSNGRATMVNLTMSHRQLGLSDEWLYEALANARSESDNIDRDYFNRWTNSSSGSLIPDHLAKAMRESESETVGSWISQENYIFRWYQEIDPEVQYVLMVDTSDAIGRDDIGIVLLDTRNGETAGAAAFNETNLIRFAQWLREFLVTYRNTTLIIERRYNAQTIIDYLLLKLPELGIDPFKRIFNQIVQKREERQKDYDRVMGPGLNRSRQLYETHRRDFGFVTDADSRKLLYSNVLMNAAKDAGHRVRDKQLIQQILSLVIKNGRIDHSASGHDDMVIAWLIGHWFLNYGINLHQYGINPARVMSERSNGGKEITPQEELERHEQKELMDTIERIHERLKSSTSQMEIMRLESELTSMMSRLKQDDSDGMTLDALIQEARETRERRLGGAAGGGGQTKLLISRYGSGR